MVDALAISSALTSLKAASDIAKTLIGLRDETQIRNKVIELQSAIIAAQTNTLDLQSEQSELLKKIRELETERDQLNSQIANRKDVPAALKCPICGEGMRVTKETADPHFDFAGVKVHHVECACGHNSTRRFRGGKYD